jgi:hypothetical protein
MEVEDVEGAVSQTYFFFSSDDPDRLYVNVSQQLAIYQDATSAAAVYPDWVSKAFPTQTWEIPPQVTFQSKADRNCSAYYAG